MLTRLLLGDQTLGVTEDDVQIGDIIKLRKDGMALVVRQVLAASDIAGSVDGEDIELPEEVRTTVDQIAYLGHVTGNRSSKKRSAVLERETAKQLNGKTTPGSGAFDFHKGDIVTKDFLIEHKFTDKDSYRLPLATWEKAALEAFGRKKIPAMEIVLTPEEDRLKLLVMPLFDFIEQMGCTEAEFSRVFYMDHLKTNKGSLLVKKDDFKQFEELVLKEHENMLPAVFVTFNDDVRLIMMRTSQFVRLFND